MKIRIVLRGPGGELGRQVIEVRDDDDSAEVSNQIQDAIEAWVLAPGDTIAITEET
jgi:dihydrodipicolinate reductase